MLCKICHNSITGNEGGEAPVFKKYQYPFAGFNSYNYEEIFGDISIDVETVLEWAKTTTDLKQVRNQLRDKMQVVKNLTLNKEHSDDLLSKIGMAFEDLNQRQMEENAKYEEEFNENYNKLKSIVDEAIVFAVDTMNFVKARENLIAAQNEFKEIRLKPAHRDELFTKLKQAFEDLSKRQTEERERYEMECIENFHSLKNIIDEALLFIETSANFSKSRETLIKTQNAFKGLKLKKDQREEQYKRIQDAFEVLNHQQAEEREKFEVECNDNYVNLKKMVDESITFVQTSTDYKDARETLIKAQNTIKGFKLTRQQRDDLYSLIRRVFDDLNRRQSEDRKNFEKESNENYLNLTKKIEEAAADMQILTDFRHIREILIAIQSEVMIVNLKRERRNELFSRIREAFSDLDKKRVEYRELKRQEKVEKLQSILTNLQSKALRIDESLGRDKEALVIHKEKLAQMETSENINEAAMDDLKNRLQAIESRLQDKETSLNEINTRINDIQKELTSEE
jgi:hypothetical protein